MIKSGANVNVFNIDNDTPLHYAVKNKNASLVVLLLENGAQVGVKNDLDLTPLYWAQPNSHIESFLKYALMQQQSADFRRKNHGCCTIS